MMITMRLGERERAGNSICCRFRTGSANRLANSSAGAWSFSTQEDPCAGGFSDLAVDVIQMAIRLANAFDSTIRLIHVAGRQHPYYVGLEMGSDIIQEIHTEEIQKMETDLKAMEQYIQQKGIRVSSALLRVSRSPPSLRNAEGSKLI
jgi:nucleotide-binding universal stress UspA family protein